ncbi:MAG TPA: Uma2 family endonuclease [Chloroflexota bacterium]|nr:Uma2 family endonuclease [Chloroflexota bacterium]
MTERDLLTLPDDAWRYELVEGVLVRMPPSGRRASRIARRLAARLGDFVDAQSLGEVTVPDGGYTLAPGTDLAPDVGFMRADRLPPLDSPASDRLILGAPDLAVEVASPNQYKPEMRAKARLYLEAGTRLVWIIWPRHRRVDVWHPGDTLPSAMRKVGDSLDGEDVVPGFVYAVGDLFA